jgi:hypothetical protein
MAASFDLANEQTDTGRMARLSKELKTASRTYPPGKALTLQRGFLDNTHIADGSIASLGELALLRHLSIKGAEITPNGMRIIRRIFPKAEIVCDEDK